MGASLMRPTTAQLAVASFFHSWLTDGYVRGVNQYNKLAYALYESGATTEKAHVSAFETT